MRRFGAVATVRLRPLTALTARCLGRRRTPRGRRLRCRSGDSAPCGKRRTGRGAMEGTHTGLMVRRPRPRTEARSCSRPVGATRWASCPTVEECSLLVFTEAEPRFAHRTKRGKKGPVSLPFPSEGPAAYPPRIPHCSGSRGARRRGLRGQFGIEGSRSGGESVR